MDSSFQRIVNWWLLARMPLPGAASVHARSTWPDGHAQEFPTAMKAIERADVRNTGTWHGRVRLSNGAAQGAAENGWAVFQALAPRYCSLSI
jgi:hypothetical protein